MTPWITRVAAVTAAGRGVDVLADAITAGTPLARPVAYATADLGSPFAATVEGATAESLLDEVVRDVLPGESAGLVVGTASGDVSGGGPLAWRQGPTERCAARHALTPFLTLSVACASGTAAFEIARGWLRDGRCERVIVAGVDALSLFVHGGFAGLGALARERSRPFRADRDGLMLGEGAAAFLLETPASARRAGRTRLTSLLGCGLSQDGVHVTAPDRTGAGLERAIRAALADAAVDAAEVGLVSAHATGTPFNDAMEARAFGRVFPEGVPLHVAKPVIGHTLGAAGAIEAAALLAYQGGSPPPPALEPSLDCPMVAVAARPGRAALSASAAFGGVNAALVFGDGDGRPFAPRGVVLVRTATIDAEDLRLADLPIAVPATLGRTDTYVRGCIAALAGVRDLLDADTAVVLSSTTGCRQADVRYDAELRQKGPARASRIHFTYTTPGSALAEAAILLGLRGPALVLCADADAGRLEAQRLVAHGVADRAVALHLEAPERRAVAQVWVFGCAT